MSSPNTISVNPNLTSDISINISSPQIQQTATPAPAAPAADPAPQSQQQPKQPSIYGKL